MKSDFLIKIRGDLLTRIVVMLLLSGVIMMVCYGSAPALWELYTGVVFAGGIVVILGSCTRIIAGARFAFAIPRSSK